MNTGATEPMSAGASAADRIRLPTKVLVHAPFIPPHFSGLATLLYRLFERIEPSDYCLVTFHPEMPRSALEQTRRLPALPATRHWLPGRWRSLGHAWYGYPLPAVRDLRRCGQEVVHRGRMLANLACEERCGAIVVVRRRSAKSPSIWRSSTRSHRRLRSSPGGRTACYP
jgi:hypothetical protein